MELTPDCCDLWSHFLGRFDWMRDPESDVLLMPHVKTPSGLWRVNHCPSCGKDVRGCIVKPERVWTADIADRSAQ